MQRKRYSSFSEGGERQREWTTGFSISSIPIVYVWNALRKVFNTGLIGNMEIMRETIGPFCCFASVCEASPSSSFWRTQIHGYKKQDHMWLETNVEHGETDKLSYSPSQSEIRLYGKREGFLPSSGFIIVSNSSSKQACYCMNCRQITLKLAPFGSSRRSGITGGNRR